MGFLRRSQQDPSTPPSEVIQPARLPKPLPSRDVRALLVAQAVVDQAEHDEQKVAADDDDRSDTAVIPPEVRAWARNILGKEACSCSIHCPGL